MDDNEISVLKESVKIAYWERNMLALYYADGWYYDNENNWDGWKRVLALEGGKMNFHIPDDFDVGELEQIEPTYDGHTTIEKWKRVSDIMGINFGRKPLKYRKKPVEIEAIIWNGNNRDEVRDFIKATNIEIVDVFVVIETLEGNMKALPGDYIIKGTQGEYYPCKPDIFKEVYERVDDETGMD